MDNNDNVYYTYLNLTEWKQSYVSGFQFATEQAMIQIEAMEYNTGQKLVDARNMAQIKLDMAMIEIERAMELVIGVLKVYWSEDEMKEMIKLYMQHPILIKSVKVQQQIGADMAECLTNYGNDITRRAAASMTIVNPHFAAELRAMGLLD